MYLLYALFSYLELFSSHMMLTLLRQLVSRYHMKEENRNYKLTSIKKRKQAPYDMAAELLAKTF